MIRSSRNTTAVAFLVCLVMFAGAASAASGPAATAKTPAWVKDLPIAKVIEWRRHIHQNPELSYKETNTSAYVEGILKSFGNIEVSRPTPTSVLGILRGGKPGRILGFRADMDALPVPEDTGLSFSSSVPGVSHACGHDSHTAILLGTASVLSRMQKDLHGTIYFIFQHAEEQAPGGAQELVKTGALKDVQAFFMFHTAPNLPVGMIGILPKGPASTAADGFNLKIIGKGTHGSAPQNGIDPIFIGSEVVVALQSVVSRSVEPGDLAVVTVGKFQGGAANNVIPDTAELAATVRTVKESTRKLVAERVRALIEGIVKANGATCELDYFFGIPVVVNDAALVDLAAASGTRILGPGKVFMAPRMGGSEDFANYRDIAPICAMFFGIGPSEPNHSPRFKIDEASFEYAMKAEVQIILDYLNQKSK